MNRTSMIGLRIPTQLMDELEVHVGPGKKYPNMSACIRELTRMGLQVIQYQSIMKDPSRSKEFVEKMNDYIQNENIMEWGATLDNAQLDGILMLIQMEKEKRYDQKTFI